MSPTASISRLCGAALRQTIPALDAETATAHAIVIAFAGVDEPRGRAGWKLAEALRKARTAAAELAALLDTPETAPRPDGITQDSYGPEVG